MSKNKKRNKEIRFRKKLEEEIENNPNICFCEELGIENEVDYNNIIKTEYVDGFPHPETKNFRIDIYSGKETTLKIVF
jgi:hypothetical protein